MGKSAATENNPKPDKLSKKRCQQKLGTSIPPLTIAIGTAATIDHSPNPQQA